MNRFQVLRMAAGGAVVFGVATIGSGGNVLFGQGAAAAGEYVGFVVWFNFLAGFAYALAGVGLWFKQRWAAIVALTLAIATCTIFAAFGVHIWTGGVFEMRTVAAMALRSIVWIVIAALACSTYGCRTARAVTGSALRGKEPTAV